MSNCLIAEVKAAGNPEVLLATEVVEARGAARLETVFLRDNRLGEIPERLALGMFVLINAIPAPTGYPRRLHVMNEVMYIPDQMYSE